MADEFEDLPDPEFSHFPWAEPTRPEGAPTTRRVRRWPLTAEATPAASSPVEFDPSQPFEPAPAAAIDKRPSRDISFDDLIPGASNAFDMFDDLIPEEKPSVAEDVAKSAGVGLAKGAIGVPAAPGNISELLHRAGDKVGSFLGEKFPETGQRLREYAAENARKYGRLMNRGDVLGDVPLPTSETFQTPIESVTGKFYEPKTTAGKYAETISEFAPALVGGEAPLAERILSRMVIPGVASETAGQATAGTEWEPWARLAAGAAGLGAVPAANRAAAAVSRAAKNAEREAAGLPTLPPPRAEPFTGARGPAEPSPEPPPTATPRQGLNENVRLLTPDVPHSYASPRGSVGAARAVTPLETLSPEARQILQEKFDAQGFNEHTIDQRIEEMSPHEMLGEVTADFEGHTAGIQSQPGAGRTEIAQAVRQRHAESPERINNELDVAFGRNINRTQWERQVRQARANESRPFWERFNNLQIPPSPAIEGILPRLEASGATAAANKALRTEGLPLTMGFPEEAAATDQVRVPTARAFQNAKEFLDDKIEGAIRAGERNEARRFTGLKRALVQAIDEHPDPNVAGVWREAREVWARPTALLNAKKLGEEILTDRVHVEQLSELVGDMSDAELQALVYGIRGRFADIAGGRGNRVPTRLIDETLSPANREKIARIIGDERANDLFAAMEHERRIRGAQQRLIGGSPTAERRAFQQQWTPDALSTPAGRALRASKFVAEASHRPVRTIIGIGAKKAAEALERHQELQAQRLREEISRVLTLQGPERDAVLRELAARSQQTPINPTTAQPPQGGVFYTTRASGGRVDPRGLPISTRKESQYASDRGKPGHHCGPDQQWPHGFCAKFRDPHRCIEVAGVISTKGGCDWFQPADYGEREERKFGGTAPPTVMPPGPQPLATGGGVSDRRYVRVHGLDIAIEHEKGETSGAVKLPFHYGYVQSADSKRIDVMVGPHLKSEKVFVVERVGVMVGFGSIAQAQAHYLKAFPDGDGKKRPRSITEMTIEQFKKWLKGNTTSFDRAQTERRDRVYAALQRARKAIRRGAARGPIIEHLREHGIDPAGI